MIFEFTDHALMRMKERNIPDPLKAGVRLAKQKAKRLIKKQCPKNKYRNDCVYFRTNDRISSERSVYVCTVLGFRHYQVITAFKLNYELLDV